MIALLANFVFAIPLANLVIMLNSENLSENLKMNHSSALQTG